LSGPQPDKRVVRKPIYDANEIRVRESSSIDAEVLGERKGNEFRDGITVT